MRKASTPGSGVLQWSAVLVCAFAVLLPLACHSTTPKTNPDGGLAAGGFCTSCKTAADCGPGKNFCLVDKAGASYCAVDCSAGQTCSKDAVCKEVHDPDGGALLGDVCEPITGQCHPCGPSGTTCGGTQSCCQGFYCQSFGSDDFCAPIGSGTPACNQPGTNCAAGQDCCLTESCVLDAGVGTCAQGVSTCETSCTTTANCSCPDYFCHGGVCSLGTACSTQGNVCNTDVDCCSGLACADHKCLNVTCHAVGGLCDTAGMIFGCCNGLTCENGLCTESDGGVCLNRGNGCADGASCCPGLLCAPTMGGGSCSLNCCVPNGSSCANDADCCGLQTDGTCVAETPRCNNNVCCFDINSSCNADNDCCSGSCGGSHTCN